LRSYVELFSECRRRRPNYCPFRSVCVETTRICRGIAGQVVVHSSRRHCGNRSARGFANLCLICGGGNTFFPPTKEQCLSTSPKTSHNHAVVMNSVDRTAVPPEALPEVTIKRQLRCQNFYAFRATTRLQEHWDEWILLAAAVAQPLPSVLSPSATSCPNPASGHCIGSGDPGHHPNQDAERQQMVWRAHPLEHLLGHPIRAHPPAGERQADRYSEAQQLPSRCCPGCPAML